MSHRIEKTERPILRDMSLGHYLQLKAQVEDMGGRNEITRSECVQLVVAPDEFWKEYTLVVCDKGASEQFTRVKLIMATGGRPSSVENRSRLTEAVDWVWARRFELLHRYQIASSKLDFLETLPLIGPVSKYALARKLGYDCVESDPILDSVSPGESSSDLCQRLRLLSGDRMATVAFVIRRSHECGLLA